MKNRLIALILTLSLLAGLLIFPVQAASVCPGGASCPSRSFRDVPAPDNWAHEGIDFCIENGIMNGTSATKFSPSGVMTRAMVVTVLYRQSGSPSVTGLKNVFTDVSSGMWYTDAIVWANVNEIVNGTSATTFSPDKPVTREQLATILMRYANTVGKKTAATTSLSAFPDESSVDRWAQFAMRWAVAEEIIRGKGTGASVHLVPRGNATRAEVATILMRFIGLQDALPALNDPAKCTHSNMQTIPFAGTCTTDGGYTYYCPDCAASDTVIESYAQGHDVDDYGVCSRCGQYVGVIFYDIDGNVGLGTEDTASEWIDEGWFRIDDYISKIKNKKVDTLAIDDSVAALQSVEYNAKSRLYKAAQADLEKICAAWKSISLYPIAIVDYEVEYYYGVNEATLLLRNLSGKKINYVELSFRCIDGNGNSVRYYNAGDDTFLGYFDEPGLEPYEALYITWDLYGYDNCSNLKYIAIDRIEYADGTVWTKK